MRISNEAVFSATSDAATISSAVCDISSMAAVSFITTFSDSAAGSLSIYVSNNPVTQKPLANDPSWVLIPDSTATKTVTAGATTLVFATTNVSYMWAKLVWTPTSGAGTMTSYIKASGF